MNTSGSSTQSNRQMETEGHEALQDRGQRRPEEQTEDRDRGGQQAEEETVNDCKYRVLPDGTIEDRRSNIMSLEDIIAHHLLEEYEEYEEYEKDAGRRTSKGAERAGKTASDSAEGERKYVNFAEMRRQNVLGRRITELRRQQGFTQEELSEALEEYGREISPSTVSRWESGKIEPNALDLLALYKVFQLDPHFRILEDELPQSELTPDEWRLLRRVQAYLKEELDRRPNIRLVTLPLFRNGRYETIDVAETAIPYGADFAMEVPDDAMEPLIRKGDRIYAQYAREFVEGDIVVAYRGERILIRTYWRFGLADEHRKCFLYKIGPEIRVFARVLL